MEPSITLRPGKFPGSPSHICGLINAIANQSLFEFYNIPGTLVGIWSPSFVNGVNVVSYHLHLITADRKAGGHVLGLRLRDAKVKIDITKDFGMDPPTNDDYYNESLTKAPSAGQNLSAEI
jgi:acetolactate decarboxylase